MTICKDKKSSFIFDFSFLSFLKTKRFSLVSNFYFFAVSFRFLQMFEATREIHFVLRVPFTSLECTFACFFSFSSSLHFGLVHYRCCTACMCAICNLHEISFFIFLLFFPSLSLVCFEKTKHKINSFVSLL